MAFLHVCSHRVARLRVRLLVLGNVCYGVFCGVSGVSLEMSGASGGLKVLSGCAKGRGVWAAENFRKVSAWFLHVMVLGGENFF